MRAPSLRCREDLHVRPFIRFPLPSTRAWFHQAAAPKAIDRTPKDTDNRPHAAFAPHEPPCGSAMMKRPIGFGNVAPTPAEPAFAACVSAKPMSKRVFRCPIRCLFPGATRRLKTAAPSQKLALGGDPFPELVPAPENRLVRDLGIGLARLGRGRDQKPVGIAGKARRRAATPRRRTRREGRGAASARRPRARSRA